ncbi:MAG: carboxypeptidase regulatory-like domain-containing protein [Acidobacteriota bacterium]|nr:carboxypeptidase regulatory-like domain-containing protein [Acidobacteriota bacterium]
MAKLYIGLFLLGLTVACGGGGETASEVAPEAESIAATPETPQSSAPDLSQSGSVTGRVSFEGEAPKMARIRMGAEPSCEEKHGGPIYSQDVVVNDNGTLKNVFIWIKEGMDQYSFETPSDPAVLDQDGCLYTPHVLGVQMGQGIQMLNSDQATHNIHPVPANNREWNISQAAGQEMTRSFPRQEITIPVKCNIHPWMKSYIAVVPHPYFSVTSDDGTFEINNMPPGDYTIEVWHETYGTQEQQIKIDPNSSQNIEFSYSG